MSGLDFSKFSLCSALTPLQPAAARSYPADPSQQHVAEDVIDSHICNTQRDDLPSSPQSTLRSRERASTLSSPYQGQGPTGCPFAFPRSPLQTESADDIQGRMLCDQLGGFHFTPQYTHGGSVDEPVNVPTAIIENSSWGSQHSLHYPTPVRGSVAHFIKGAGGIPEDARLGLIHRDVSARVPARRASTAVTDRPLGTSCDFGLPSPLPSIAVNVGAFLQGGTITSPSPPPTAYHEEDFSDCARPFLYDEHLPAMTRSPAHEPARHYPFDRATVQSLGGFRKAAHQSIISFDHRFVAGVATPFPGYSSSQSPHDHPIYEASSFGTAIHVDELPRPGSAPPLIDSQVPFTGDPRAVLQSFPEDAVTGDVNRPHGWHSPSPPSQSPRSSPRRAGSIGHNSQKTPPGSRHGHLRRWSSVTNPALRASPPFPPSSFSPNLAPFPRYPISPSGHSSSENVFAHFSPCSESESDDMSTHSMQHAAATVELGEAVAVDPQQGPPPQQSHQRHLQQQQQQQQQQLQQPPTRTAVRCDGYVIDEESWTAALARPDKQIHVYECFWDVAHSPCGMWVEGDQSSVADHLALFHGFRGGEVTTRCLWRDCPKPLMKGTSIARHLVTHIGFRVKCHTCKHEFARVDACNRAHSRSGCLGVGQPMYGDLQRVLDARKVEPLQRPSKKRRTDE